MSQADNQSTAAIFKRLVSGRFGKIALPAIILQSVLIGGGYASGREVVAYGAKYGSAGWLSILAIFVGFTVMAMLTFELARTFRVYEYKGFIKQIIGPAWPLFDVIFLAMAVLIIAIMASAAGNIMEQTIGIPYLGGIVGIIGLVGVLTYFGAGLIERFKMVGTGFLYLAYITFGVVVLSQVWGDVTTVFASANTSYVADAGLGSVLSSGALYVGYNLAVYPAVFFCLHRQETRKESIVSGLLAGLLMTLPFTLTYLALLGFYPSEAVMGAEVPWLAMLDQIGSPAIIALYGVVMGWTLIETSVGLIHAIIDRVDESINQLSTATFEDADGLTRLQSGLLGGSILVLATILSRVGIIALVAQGYTIMAYFFIALFAVPLLTVGLYRIVNPSVTLPLLDVRNNRPQQERN
ncbi:hypothetical protein [Haloarchaeobius sp. HME9146]|uniref:YkvI family membrane protein n=1 Tax=Haloarchaeobius sp. HME9146 TaxID=2978732 RepID=UPI0021C1B155|nr:hypothetical protein [Haloarchaeobius sp. HME9146]MCT9097177.1 hypothetical protein [Haloarchaeobius sp. HME9146]